MRVCNVPNCPTLFKGTGGRCPEHSKQARRARVGNDVYSSSGHRDFRTAVLQREPVCSRCRNARATVADHYPYSRRELVDAGLNPNDPQYGRGLCHQCHSIETAKHQPGGWNAR